MTRWKLYTQAWILKMSRMKMNKRIEKGKELLSDIGGKGMLEITTG